MSYTSLSIKKLEQSDAERGLIRGDSLASDLWVEIDDPPPIGVWDFISQLPEHFPAGCWLSMLPMDSPRKLPSDQVNSFTNRMTISTLKTLIIGVVWMVVSLSAVFVLASAHQCYVKSPSFQEVVYVICAVHLATAPFVLYWTLLILKAKTEDEIDVALNHEDHIPMIFMLGLHAANILLMMCVRGRFLNKSDFVYSPQAPYLFIFVVLFGALSIISCLRRCLMLETALGVPAWMRERISVLIHICQVIVLIVLCGMYYDYFQHDFTVTLTTAIVLIVVILFLRHFIPTYFSSSWRMFRWNGPCICLFHLVTFVLMYKLTIGDMIQEIPS